MNEPTTIKDICDAELMPRDYFIEYIPVEQALPEFGIEVMVVLRNKDTQKEIFVMGFRGIKMHDKDECRFMIPRYDDGFYGDVVGWQYKPKPIQMDRAVKV